MPWRLRVIDGADAQRVFPLPEAGSVVIGNSHKHADICLHDLLVARVHCQIDVEDGVISVTAQSDDKDTRVNGNKVATHVLQAGEVLRAGNSQLLLEEDDGSHPGADEEPADGEPEPLPQVSWDGLERLSGHTLGRFEIGQVLGRGHTGVTFRSRDTQSHREMALKIIGPEFPTNPEELQQFARTIRKVASIQEPNLVTWYAAGRTSRYVWIAQELVEGESLEHMLKRGQSASLMLKWRNALKLGIDLAKALAAIHGRRMVHGNLTPANVVIGTDRTAKLNDLLYEEALRDSKWYGERLEVKLLTELPYLAPERLDEGAYWDGAADIYSLGALVYARLTTRPPFEGADPGEVIEAIRAGRPTKPRDIVRGCPEGFQAAVLKMLSRNQEDRYPTPAILLGELEGLQATL